jgi:two-component system KDP operon response regulator KdpE
MMTETGRHALVIEDDVGLARLVTLILTGAGFRVSLKPDADAGVAATKDDPPDVILLDLALPDLSCGEPLANCQTNYQAPVIVITGAHNQDWLVDCLRMGAFDLALKPFDPEDLEDCVRLAVGADFECPTTVPALRRDDLEIDFASYRFMRGGQRLRLSLTEWRLLEMLATRPGEVVLDQELLRRVWGPHFRSHLAFLQAWMSRLQKKVGLAEFHGVGYSLEL